MGNFRNAHGQGDRRWGGRRQQPSYRSMFGGQGSKSGTERRGNEDGEGERGSSRAAYVERREHAVEIDKQMSVEELPPGGGPRVGWLYNMAAATVEDPATKRPVQAVDLFFIPEDGGTDFRATVIARPYMYVAVAPDFAREVETTLRRTYADLVADVARVHLEDLAMPNHLATDGGRCFLKVEARTSFDLNQMRIDLQDHVTRNRERNKRAAAVDPSVLAGAGNSTSIIRDAGNGLSGFDHVEDVREYDVAAVNRFAIDNHVNVGYWYRVIPSGSEDQLTEDQEVRESELDPDQHRDPNLDGEASNSFSSARLVKLPEIVDRASPVVLAYDIECTKAPLKFPDADAGDQVMMISWMVDGKGYLGINREVVSADIEDFEYAPKKDYRGDFEVFNEKDELALLERFFLEVRLAAPRVFVTFNGDFFDWPFVENRARKHGIVMGDQIGMATNDGTSGTPQTSGRTAVHMDVFHWVNRDSYLPQGSRGLKAVTRALLGFEPEEIPPEEMMAAARDRPHEMAKYSVSDAVCTYFLYMKYVHPFTFSLCNIIPLGPDDVLRKGSGTLCEMLLMCQAFDKRIVAPNKTNSSAMGKLTRDGHVLESETYIGGHVEALQTGVYRSDLPVTFKIEKSALVDLENQLDETLKFAIETEGRLKLDDVTNYDEIRSAIVQSLHELGSKSERTEKPLIYHLDVSAMYPNIILTNRLQPTSIVSAEQCAACDFNGTSDCQRVMEWTWRGEFFPASRGEAEMVQRRVHQTARETEDAADNDRGPTTGTSAGRYADPPRGSGQYSGRRGRDLRGKAKESTQAARPAPADAPKFSDEAARKDESFRRRLKEYCKTNYKRALATRTESREAIVCQRENPFYVDTVRAFRDRRYEYKALLKKQKKAKAAAAESGDSAALLDAEKKIVLYDSLQLAHKCILNSFYGYVMRKGARWYSMEMAGVVTHTGALIIRRAREFIDRVGVSLELDTDGIWCMLPVSFPETYTFTTASGKKHSMSFICSVFNSDVAKNFTNHQYQDLEDASTLEYSQRSECSILFEVDGPYRAMVLPASLEEGKSIKKRYAVFNDDGSLAELKGFEIKRRGELKLIKQFQGEIFKRFLCGDTLKACYTDVGATCSKWVNILTSKGEGMTDAEIIELLVEQNNMSKPLAEYLQLGQKSLAITCATRMKKFLGDAIVANSGLATMYVVSAQPSEAQVTERAIPVQVFDLENEALRSRLLRQWTGSESVDFRSLIDWDYYKGRLANAVLKIVSIPAALQAMDNPVPEIEYPAWLVKRCREAQDSLKQKSISSFFSTLPRGQTANIIHLQPVRDVVNDTSKLSDKDIEDLPLRQWTEAKQAARRKVAVVRRRKKERDAARRRKGTERNVFQSRADDPQVREFETRMHLFNLTNADHPSIRQDYPAWVSHAKKVWRAQRAARVQRYEKKRKLETLNETGGEAIEYESGVDTLDQERPRQRRRIGQDAVADYAPPNFVSDFMADTVRRKHGGLGNASFFGKPPAPLVGAGVLWQVVSIVPSASDPGNFNLWVLPLMQSSEQRVGELHRVPLRVQRSLYVSSRGKKIPLLLGAKLAEKTTASLPRSRPSGDLYRVEVDEASFQNNSKEVACAMADVLSVDGVYGTKTPLAFDAVVEIGTICSVKRSLPSSRLSSQKILSQGVTLQDLVPKKFDNAPYLVGMEDESVDSLHHAFLYCARASDGTSRAIYVLVVPAAKLVSTVVVTQASQAAVNMPKVWSDLCSHAADSGDSSSEDDVKSALPPETRFEVKATKTHPEACAEISLILSKLRDRRMGSSGPGIGRRVVLVAQWAGADTSAVSAAGLSQGRTSTPSQAGLGGQSTSQLEDCVPATALFPVLHMSHNADDGAFQPVGWEKPAATVAMRRFLESRDWIADQLMLSRFGGVPLGNLSSTDAQLHALDVMVGRELRSEDHVLWSSEGPRPDLGGAEWDDTAEPEWGSSAPEYSSPGSYRTVCVDTELTDFAIAAILSSSHINELEGTDLAFDSAAGGSMDASGGKATKGGSQRGEDAEASAGPLDEMAGSASAFRVIKSMVHRWHKAASSPVDDEVRSGARTALDHFFRWISSETALLYDPCLARFLTWLMKKFFWQLLHELKQLGTGIVYASTSRLVLATPKTEAVDALRYAGFLERTVKSKPIFQHIRFAPLLGVSSSMLFIDRFNYGVVPAPEEQAILSGEFTPGMAAPGGSNRTYAEASVPPCTMVWDMARYMPAPVATLWCQVVEEFIRRPLLERMRKEREEDEEFAKARADADAKEQRDIEEQAREDELALQEMEGVVAARANITPAGPQALVGDKPAALPKTQRKRLPRGDGYVDEVKALMRGMTSELLAKVQEIREKAPLLDYPAVPCALDAARDAPRNPSLEFVRTLCHVLSLDKAASEAVADMKRTLLRLLGVREFSRTAQFVDPGLPVVVHNVICSYCNAVVDLDVARDARLWQPVLDQTDDSHGANSPWSCQICSHPYDKQAIELSLVRDVQRLVTSFQTQDLVCRRCKMVKQDNMSTHCACSGAKYDLNVDQAKFSRALRSLASIASFHGFELLQETVEWVNQSCT